MVCNCYKCQKKREEYDKIMCLNKKIDKLTNENLDLEKKIEISENDNLDLEKKLESCNQPIVINMPKNDNFSLEKYKFWVKASGLWYGDLSLYNSEGLSNYSSTKPYNYRNYFSIIRIIFKDGDYIQQNIFFRPPVDLTLYSKNNIVTYENLRNNGFSVDDDGNAYKLQIDDSPPSYKAQIGNYDQSTDTFTPITTKPLFDFNKGTWEAFYANIQIDNNYNLAGPYISKYGIQDTTAEQSNNDTIIYRVKTRDITMGGNLIPGRIIQQQMTTFLNDNLKVRTAQGFSPFGPENSTYSSYYRERKVNDVEGKKLIDDLIQTCKISQDDKLEHPVEKDANGLPLIIDHYSWLL